MTGASDWIGKIGSPFERYYLFVFIVLFLIYLSPLAILQENSYIAIHDNLDSEISWYTVLARSGKTFDPRARIDQIMNGIPRACLPSGLSVITWLFLVFSPFTAYSINHVLVHVSAFIGMYLLLERHLKKREGVDKFIAVGVAFCFAVLPFYSIYGLSIAGQPLLLFVFLNIISKKAASILDYLIILLFPFYSSLVLSGIFIVSALGIWFIADWVRNRKLNTHFALGILLLGFTYLVVEYNLLDSMFVSETFVSHRIEWDFYSQSIPLYQAIKRTFLNFVFGQYHAASLHQCIVLIAVPLAGISAYLKRLDSSKLFFTLLAVALLFSTVYGFQHWNGLIPIKEKVNILYTFNFSRFHWLHPMLWYVIFALSLSLISKIGWEGGRCLVIGLIVFQILFNLGHNVELTQPVENFVKRVVGISDRSISYSQFFSEDLFGEIKRYIGEPQEDYRVISIGLHPSIAQYNGFYTLDSYQHNYPLAYKHQFRKIIAQELEKNERWRDYFDAWGSRCYVFVDEVKGFTVTKDQSVEVSGLILNTEALKEMGGRYILSAVEILNYEENNLRLLNVFENDKSPWRIYLYQVE